MRYVVILALLALAGCAHTDYQPPGEGLYLGVPKVLD